MSKYTYEEVRAFQERAERAEKRLGAALQWLRTADEWADFNAAAEAELAAFLATIDAECETKPDGRVVDRVANARCGLTCIYCNWRCDGPKGHALIECLRCKCIPDERPKEKR